MKKQIVFLNIFLFFIILFPAFGEDIVSDGIDKISPPLWIHGEWILEEDEDNDDPFYIEFAENDIYEMDYSMGDDIEDGYIVAFTQDITDEYYEIYVEYDDGFWWQERFFIVSDNNEILESEYIDSDGADKALTYYKY